MTAPYRHPEDCPEPTPVTFQQALDSARYTPSTPEAHACIRALERQEAVRGHRTDKAARRRSEGTPALNALYKSLRDDAGCSMGRLLLSVLRAERVPAIIALVAHLSKAKKKYTAGEAAELHADCYLALNAWVVKWNRDTMRLLP